MNNGILGVLIIIISATFSFSVETVSACAAVTEVLAVSMLKQSNNQVLHVDQDVQLISGVL